MGAGERMSNMSNGKIVSCNLINLAKSEKLTLDYCHRRTKTLERILDLDEFEITVVKCNECGKIFIKCFKEYRTGGWDEYIHIFWIPVEDNDLENIRKTKNLAWFMMDLVTNRSHICCWPSAKTLHWAKGKSNVSAIAFLP